MVPDFEFLLRLKETACFGHTWLGLVVFDIPFGILLSFIFHGLIRNVLVLHLPRPLRERFAVFVSFNWKQYVMQNKARFLLSLLAGICSHVVIDAFTHSDGFIATGHSFFYKEISIWIFPLPVYYILQLATSLLGAIYILWLIFKMKRGDDVRRVNSSGYWFYLSALTLCIFLVRLIARHTTESFSDIVIAILGSFFYAIVMLSFFYLRKPVLLNKKSPV